MDTRTSNIIKIVAFVLIAALSFFVISPYATSIQTYDKQITSLDEKKENVLKLTAAATASSVAVSCLPGDSATPVAEKIADLSQYFLIVLCAIALEKYLLTVTGLASFKLLVPIGCLLLALNVKTKNKMIRQLAIKLLVLGFAIVCVIPASIFVSNTIETTYDNTIQETLDITESTTDEINDALNISDEETTTSSTDISNTSNTSNAADNSKSSKGILGSVSDLIDGAAGTIDTISNTISEAASGELLEKAEAVFNKYLEAVAVMIITSCVIPIIVMLFFYWLIKLLLGIDVASGHHM